VLVSAYDFYHKNIETIPSYAELVFLDSGGYECSEQSDFSETGYVGARSKARSDKKKRRENWNEGMYLETLRKWPSGIANCHTVMISYDHPDHRQSTPKQIVQAHGTLDTRDDVLKEILLKPETPQAEYLNIDAVLDHIEGLKLFDIVGVTEKELGTSVLERMCNIVRMRLAMERKGFTRPLHVFGSLDTISTPLYFVSGADIFDGLTWLRYSYIDGLTVYWQNYGAREYLNSKTQTVLRKNMVDNLYHLIVMRQQMTRYLADEDFDHFEQNAAVIRKGYQDLQSSLSSMREV